MASGVGVLSMSGVERGREAAKMMFCGRRRGEFSANEV